MKRAVPIGFLTAAALVAGITACTSASGDPPSVIAAAPGSAAPAPTTTEAPAEHDHAMDHDGITDMDMDMDLDMDMDVDEHGDMDEHEAMEHDAGGDTTAGHAHGALLPLAQRRAQSTPAQVAAADQLWADTRAALAPYEDIDNALAAGFVANKDQVGGVVVHYPNARNRRDDHQLDPAHPEGLVYRFSPDGTATLLGAVYTAQHGEPAPTPAGPMFSWHTHEASCGSFYVPAGACTDTFRMLHVWTAHGVVDPFTQPFSKATRPA